MKEPTKTGEFISKDLSIVAYLLTTGFKFSGHPTQDEQNLIYFHFLRTRELEKAQRDFYDHKASVDPIEILEKYQSLKSIIWKIRKGKDLEIYEEKDFNQKHRKVRPVLIDEDSL